MNICVFGGSATWGEDDSVNGGWVTLLRNQLAPQRIYTYNLGISGDTTNEMVSRAKSEAKMRKPDVIIFSIGLNDSALIDPEQRPRVSPQKFQDNLTKLLSIGQEFTKHIIFIGPTSVIESKTTPIPWDKEKYYTNASAKQFNESLKTFCTSHQATFISINSLLLSGDIAEDGLHPNTDGHKKIFDTVKSVVQTLLK